MIQNVVLVGGDERALRLLPLLSSYGYSVRSMGLVPEDEKTARLEEADALLFPFPTSVKRDKIPTLTGLTLYPQDVLGVAKAEAVVIASAGLESYLSAQNAMGKRLRLRLYQSQEAFLQANAELSAEATVFELMKLKPITLYDQTVLVIGYGRYGRATAQRLRKLGATVWVAARREKQRLLASGDGMRALDIQDIPEIASELDAVLNTVPSLILEEAQLAALPKSCDLLELASPPYGIDATAAQKLELPYWLLTALPARYAPQSAAKELVRACTRLLTEGDV
ncbi:MAG: dipicolinate synthase subunit DpsA [Eubacteriales bacterium]|nr:dipicolinate synthase subunit DpsA [Eubacteriales bacterium]